MQLSFLARNAAVAGLIAVAGCGSKSEAPAAQQKPAATLDAGQGASQAPAGPKAEFRGTLRGIVKLAPGAQMPLAPPPSKTDVVAAQECPPIAESDRRQVTENMATQGLTPLHVALTGMSAAPERAPVTHELEIRDCRFAPTMIAAMTRDKLHVVNHSKVPFLPLLPGDTFMQALLPGAERDVDIKGIGPLILKCGLGSYCGESVLLSTAHPLYAVTDAEGRFTITGVPLDEALTVHAWHPLFKPAEASVKLTKDELSKDVELLIEPVSAPEPPATEAAPVKLKTKAEKKPGK